MNKQTQIIIPFLLLLFVSNIYSQTDRFDKLLEFSENRIFKTIQKQDFDSISVIDSIIVTDADSSYNKYYYTYDAAGNRILEISEHLYKSFLDSTRKTNTYDSYSNKILMLEEKRNWSDDEFENFYQITYYYDSNGNMISELNEGWDGSQWVNSSSITYNYDTNGNMSSKLGEKWISSQWVKSMRDTFIYDTNGNMTSKLTERWKESNWVNFTLETYPHDFNGNMISNLSEFWDGSTWINGRRIFYFYDPNENMTFSYSEDWDGSNWVNYTRCTYTYDTNSNVTFATNEKLQDGNWAIGNGLIHFYDSFGELYYFNAHEVNIYYGNIITNLLAENEIITEFNLYQNYPNPFNPSTTIKYSIPTVETHGHASVQLVVYDILGREVTTLVNEQQKPGYYEINWNANNISSGVYFYRINATPSGGQAGSFTRTKKMLLLQ